MEYYINIIKYQIIEVNNNKPLERALLKKKKKDRILMSICVCKILIQPTCSLGKISVHAFTKKKQQNTKCLQFPFGSAKISIVV